MEVIKKKVGELEVSVWSNRLESGAAAGRDTADRIKKLIEEKGEARVVFAAAPSQNESLEYLKNSDVDWTKVRAFHLDEYVDLRADHPARFGTFLRRRICPITRCGRRPTPAATPRTATSTMTEITPALATSTRS